MTPSLMEKEKKFCSIGDRVIINKEISTTPWPGELPEIVEVGSKYVIIGLTGNGWDLKKISGNGPNELRILNSVISKFVNICNS